jgi:3-oxoadipate enol-lactonase
MEITMPLVNVNGTQLYYEEHGTGQPLVFLHGLGLDHTMWAPQIEVFSRTHRVITLDARGAGQSGKQTGWRHILRRQAADLKALLDHLGIDRIVLAGVSFGGVLTQRFVLDYPEACAGLIITDSFGSTRPHNLRDVGLMITLNLGAPAWLLPAGMLIPAVSRTYTDWPQAQRALVDGIRSMRKLETVKIRYAINWIDFLPDLHRVTCPTLGIVGDHEPLLINYMREVTGAIPGARLEIVPNSFDPTNLCQTETFNRLTADFLRQIGWG